MGFAIVAISNATQEGDASSHPWEVTLRHDFFGFPQGHYRGTTGIAHRSLSTSHWTSIIAMLKRLGGQHFATVDTPERSKGREQFFGTDACRKLAASFDQCRNLAMLRLSSESTADYEYIEKFFRIGAVDGFVVLC